MDNTKESKDIEKSLVPNIPKDLLDELNKRIPDAFPDVEDIEEFRFRQGQVSVIRFLNHQFKLQNQNILET